MSRVRYRLDSLLTQYELTAKDVSEATGIRQATLSAMRRNTLRRLTDEVLVALVCYFRQYEPDFEAGDLYEGIDCAPAPPPAP